MGLQAKLIATGAALLLLIGFLSWARHAIYITDTAPLKAQYQSERDQAISDANGKVIAANARATLAEKTGNAATKAYKDYLDAHPTGAVRMCHPVSQVLSGQAGAGAAGGGSPSNRNTAPGGVGTVPGGNPGQIQQQGPDIGPDLAAELRATLALVTVGRECEENLPQ